MCYVPLMTLQPNNPVQAAAQTGATLNAANWAAAKLFPVPTVIKSPQTASWWGTQNGHKAPLGAHFSILLISKTTINLSMIKTHL